MGKIYWYNEKTYWIKKNDKKDINEIILIGGSIPKIRQIVKDFFEKEPLKKINLEEVVVYNFSNSQKTKNKRYNI